MPIVSFCDRVPRPVRCLEIFEDDPRILVFFWRVAPDIEVSVAGVGDPGGPSFRSYGAARLLEPWILIGRVIDHEFGDDAQIPLMRRIKKRAKIIERAEVRVDVEIIGDVVPVVAKRRRIKRQEPDGGNAELLEIIQPLDQAAEVAHPVAVAVAEGLDVQLVDDRVLVP